MYYFLFSCRVWCCQETGIGLLSSVSLWSDSSKSFHRATKCQASWHSSLRTPWQPVEAAKPSTSTLKASFLVPRPREIKGFVTFSFCFTKGYKWRSFDLLRLWTKTGNMWNNSSIGFTYFGKILLGLSLTGGGAGLLKYGSLTLVGWRLLRSFASSVKTQ